MAWLQSVSRQNMWKQIFDLRRCIAPRKSMLYCTEAKLSVNEKSKSISEQFADAIEAAKAKKKQKKISAPVSDSYKPRFSYSGFLRKTTWIYKDQKPSFNNSQTTVSDVKTANTKPNESKYNELDDVIKKNCKNFCLMMAYSGSNYYGMQFNEGVATIEDQLFSAMLKNNWITEEIYKNPWKIKFQRGSRTDRGVSAVRQCCSLYLPPNFNVQKLNEDLPSDIHVFGIKRVTKTFDARFQCLARTYSYTLPTIAFADYNDQLEMPNYRITADKLQKVNDVLHMYKGHTNFHNYTVEKQHFDRSSIRRIDYIECGEPFIENDVEFAKITIKGQSFMLHQIRKMIGFSLAIIRGIIPEENLKRSLTAENFNVPTAPGLGLLLEQLHFDKYDRLFGNILEKLTWDEFEDEVQHFQRTQIYPTIIQTEINEQSMVLWLDYLLAHSFSGESKEFDPEFDDEWGESDEFLKELNEREKK